MAGRIRDESIAEVREKALIDDVVGQYVTLRNAGGGGSERFPGNGAGGADDASVVRPASGAGTLTRVASALDLLVAEEWSAGGRVFVSLRKN